MTLQHGFTRVAVQQLRSQFVVCPPKRRAFLLVTVTMLILCQIVQGTNKMMKVRKNFEPIAPPHSNSCIEAAILGAPHRGQGTKINKGEGNDKS